MASKLFLKHFTVTRFGIGIADPIWYESHFEIFENITYASMCGISHPGFHWIIILDTHTPDSIKEYFKKLTEHIDHFHLLELNFFTPNHMVVGYWDWVSIELLKYLVAKNFVTDLCEEVVFSNLDYDDAWNHNILSTVDQHLYKIRDKNQQSHKTNNDGSDDQAANSINGNSGCNGIIASFQQGLLWYVDHNAIIAKQTKCQSMGAFYYGPFYKGLTPLSLAHTHAPDIANTLGYQFDEITTTKPMWLYTRHAHNVKPFASREYEKRINDEKDEYNIDPRYKTDLFFKKHFNININALQKRQNQRLADWKSIKAYQKINFVIKLIDLYARKYHLNAFGSIVASSAQKAASAMSQIKRINAAICYEIEKTHMLVTSKEVDQTRLCVKNKTRRSTLSYPGSYTVLKRFIYTDFSFKKSARTLELSEIEKTKKSLIEQTERNFTWVLLIPDNCSKDERDQFDMLLATDFPEDITTCIVVIPMLDIMYAYKGSIVWKEIFVRKVLSAQISFMPDQYSLYGYIKPGECFAPEVMSGVLQLLGSQKPTPKKHNFYIQKPLFTAGVSFITVLQLGDPLLDSPVFVSARNASNISAISFARKDWLYGADITSGKYFRSDKKNIKKKLREWQPAEHEIEQTDLSLLAMYNLAINTKLEKYTSEVLSDDEYVLLRAWMEQRAEILSQYSSDISS